MVTQFHGINGKCVTMSKASKTGLFKDQGEWTKIFRETAEALLFVHDKKYLHNDIKGDNVIIITDNSGFHAVLIDFGKACSIGNGKQYKLTKKQKEMYHKCYLHIAPELVRGTHTQSVASDVYSFGMLMYSICNLHPNAKCMSVATSCLHSGPSKRPSLHSVQQLLLL